MTEQDTISTSSSLFFPSRRGSYIKASPEATERAGQLHRKYKWTCATFANDIWLSTKRIKNDWDSKNSVLLLSNYDPFSVEYKGVLSSCVEHFFVASAFAFKTMNLATVTIGAMVMRFDRIPFIISSYYCRISPRFHVEAALLGVANLQIVHVK